MGKGDIKSAKGKRFAGSYGKTRKKTKKTAQSAAPKLSSAGKKAAAGKTSDTPKKSTAAKTAAKKETAKKETSKKTEGE